MPNNKSNPTTTKYANSKFILRYLTNVSNLYYLNVKTTSNIKGFIQNEIYFVAAISGWIGGFASTVHIITEIA